ncbi:hypothetical protein KP509_13G090100 [Ceratopteris richardii]|uniref:Uncharacterized protein n=1 Tax=Ceratopteris richardii TaxID=49495 RepID=A0A8T2TFJ6_CERRI|nr:hypothetical protein KP509_13G090100 [Ceratopteris richardii]KAH7422092.1 hypothetical protein KP509_13G090100 [Ceratopteris richardii]
MMTYFFSNPVCKGNHKTDSVIQSSTKLPEVRAVMSWLLHSDIFRPTFLQDRLCCSYADARPLQTKSWPACGVLANEARRIPCRRIKCHLDDAIDQPIEPPQYYTFEDPISGKIEPAYSANRNNIPDQPFWSPDMPGIVRRSQARRPKKSSSTPKGGKPGSRRRGAQTVVDESSLQHGIQVVDLDEEEDEDEYKDEYVVYGDPNEVEEENPQPKDLKPLPDDKLWFNWRKIPPEEEPWHEFSRPPTDAFAVMATAAAKRGQIKLFSDKPTVTEAVLARARKDALMKERLDMETRRREEIGAVAYYSEWVKAWDKDTSKEAVQKHYEETGEDVSVQLLTMFTHQTFEEYRMMMGTDPRIQRDPLCMRMTPEEMKSVWGGDPVYPTINYYQDPNAKADYRGQNFHEPSVNLLESLRKAGRLMSKEKLRQIHDQEAASQYAMEKDFEDAIAGAVDIGEKEEDEEGQGNETDKGDGDEEQEGEDLSEEDGDEEQEDEDHSEEDGKEYNEGEDDVEASEGEEELDQTMEEEGSESEEDYRKTAEEEL